MRHVPKYKINEVSVLSFEDALSLSEQPGAEYDVERWLYVPNEYEEYRYILGTRGQHPLICIGINPSTAAPDALDPTLKSAQRVALENGYDSFLMMNVSAQRATDPNDMDAEVSSYLHEQNMEAFKYLLTLTKDVWCAWGNLIEKRTYLADYLEDIIEIGNAAGANWLQADRLLKSGHPHHPLYLPHTTQLVSYEPKAL